MLRAVIRHDITREMVEGLVSHIQLVQTHFLVHRRQKFTQVGNMHPSGAARSGKRWSPDEGLSAIYTTRSWTLASLRFDSVLKQLLEHTRWLDLYSIGNIHLVWLKVLRMGTVLKKDFPSVTCITIALQVMRHVYMRHKAGYHMLPSCW